MHARIRLVNLGSHSQKTENSRADTVVPRGALIIEVWQTPSYFRRAYFPNKHDGKNKCGLADSVVFSVVLICLAALKCGQYQVTNTLPLPK
jgi:hypothetical protein